MLLFTTSWDDGDVLDRRLAEMLERHGAKATFYITKGYGEKRLNEAEIRGLSSHHEIGAHTLSHPDLRVLSREQKKEEIAGSKKWLENVLGREVAMFCYPFGRFDEESKQLVKEAGFIGARTTRLGSIILPVDPFEMETTVHAYPFPLRKKSAHAFDWRYLLQPWRRRAGELRALGVPLLALRSWESAARAALDIAAAQNGLFHLWGHSWEIEKYGMWGELERFLSYAAKKKCHFLTNEEVIKVISGGVASG